MEHLSVNAIGQVREDEIDGRRFLVAPITSIVPGVLNGSKGALYYPPEEIGRNVDSWNHVPLTMYHPTDNGQNSSARKSSMLKKHGIGFVLDSVYNGKLVHEGWFDVESLKAKDRAFGTDVYNSIKSGRPVEMSTGLYTDNTPATPGETFNGKAYDYVARNYRPDHIAVLPTQRGACSLDDGCGVNVNAAADEKRSVLGRLSSWLGITDNAPPNQPRHLEKGQYQRMNAGTGRGPVHAAAVEGHSGVQAAAEQGREDLDGDQSTVPPEDKLGVDGRVDEEELVEVSTNSETTMALTAEQKKSHVDYLVANCDCWKGAEKTLNSIPDDNLVKLVDNAKTSADNALVVNSLRETGAVDEAVAVNEIPAFIKKKMEKNGDKTKNAGFPFKKKTAGPDDDDEEDDEDDDEETKNKGDSVENNKPITERLTPDELRVWNHAASVERAAREGLVARLVANVKDKALKDRLVANHMRKDLQTLRDEVAALPVANTTQVQWTPRQADYSGAAGGPSPSTTTNSEPDLEMVPPTVNHAELAHPKLTKRLAG